jgi:hypothetical protein
MNKLDLITGLKIQTQIDGTKLITTLSFEGQEIDKCTVELPGAPITSYNYNTILGRYLQDGINAGSNIPTEAKVY